MQIRTYLTAIVGASALAMATTATQAQAASDTGSSSTSTDSSGSMGSSSTTMKHGKSGAHSLSGKVQSVSEDSLTLRNHAGKDRTLTLGSDTKYMERGKQISRSDVTEGSRVRATFTGSGDNLHATEIRVLRTGQSASKKSGMEGQSSGSSSSPSDQTGGGTGAAGTSGTGSSDVSGGGAGAKPNSDMAKPDTSDTAKPDTATGGADGGTGSSDGGY